MSRTKLSQNSIAAGAINANTMFAADVVSPHAVANTSIYSVAELLVGGTILLDNTGNIQINNGGTIGITGDTDLLTLASGALTVTGSTKITTDLAISTTLPTIAGETGTLVIGDSGAIITFDGETNFSQNVYYNSGWKYRTTDTASILQMGNSNIPFRFSYTASGSADATASFTEAMQIDGNGHVGIGMAADSTYALKVTNPGGNTYQQIFGPTGYIAELQLQSQNSSGALFLKMDNNGVGYFGTNIARDVLFYTSNAEKMRLRADGKLVIGQADADGTLHVVTATAGSVTAASSTDDLIVENSTHGGINILIPDASYGSLAFGSPSDNHGFLVDWNYSGGVGRVHTSKVGASIELKADNSVANLTLSGASGSELAAFTGKVGIGTTSVYANSILEISGGAGNAIPTATTTSDSYLAAWRMRRTAGSHVQEWYTGLRSGARHFDIFNNTDNSLAARLTTGGNLTAYGAVFGQNGSGNAVFGVDGGNGELWLGGGNSNTQNINFQITSTAYAMRLTNAGYLGIGTSAPHRRFHIAGGTATGLQITGNSTGTGSGDGMMISIRNDNNGVEFIQQENSHIAFQTNGSATSGLVIRGGGDIYTPTAGSNNVRLGYNAGVAIVSGTNSNTLIGDDAGAALNAGDSNVFIGKSAGRVENTGVLNTHVGMGAGELGTGANYSVSVGAYALYTQDDGQFNVAVGYHAMQAATVPDLNVALGPYTLQNATSGSYSVAIANGALRDTTTAHYNVAIGYHCMLENETGANNVAVGGYAMDATTTGGSYNVAVGYAALTGMGNDAIYNTAIGYNAMGGLTTGTHNVAVGGNALAYTAVTSVGNVAVGQNALYLINSGAGNTGLGNYAGDNIQGGSYNTCIGSHAQPSGGASNYQIVIGYNISGGEDSQVTIGQTSNVIQNEFDTDAAWTRTSDVRKKRNIQEDELGLEFVNNLRTVTYQWKPSNEFPEEWDEYSEENNMNLDAVMHGMIAQEVKEALDKSGCDTFTGWKERRDGSQTVSREMFVMPLIKAVQELSAKVKELEDRLDD